MHTIKTDSGKSYTYPSIAAYEAAEAWYGRTAKEDIIAFCGAHGVDLRAGDRMVDDWADIAMACYARAMS